MNPDTFSSELHSPDVAAFVAGYPLTLLNAGVTLVILFLAAALYALITPYKEISQIRDGNGAAAVSFGGVIVGLALPLAMSLNASNSLREIVMWGVASALVSLLTFRIIDLVLMGLQGRVQDGEIPAAVLLCAAKLAASFILAAALAG